MIMNGGSRVVAGAEIEGLQLKGKNPSGVGGINIICLALCRLHRPSRPLQ